MGIESAAVAVSAPRLSLVPTPSARPAPVDVIGEHAALSRVLEAVDAALIGPSLSDAWRAALTTCRDHLARHLGHDA